MTVSPAILFLGLAIGVPLMLLAISVLYYAAVLGRQAAPGRLDAHVQSMATEGVDELLLELQRAIEEIQGQMARQRQTLSDLLSDAARRPQPVAAAAPAYAAASAAPAAERVTYQASAVREMPAMQAAAGSSRPAAPAMNAAPAAPAALEAGTRPFDRGTMIHQLAAEGLSDRAIARRLRIGVEEVRLARERSGGRR